jgi:hypothetical protein
MASQNLSHKNLLNVVHVCQLNSKYVAADGMEHFDKTNKCKCWPLCCTVCRITELLYTFTASVDKMVTLNLKVSSNQQKNTKMYTVKLWWTYPG